MRYDELMHSPPSFTNQQLSLLADFVCERYDSLGEIETSTRITNPEFKRGAAKDRASIRQLNLKLRPYYKRK